jgi:hypothetical protein
VHTCDHFGTIFHLTSQSTAVVCYYPQDMRAISSANLLMNNIGTDQAQALANILKEHPTLKSLCGNKGDETELDMSGKKMRTEGAIMLAPEIINNGAMTSLNISSTWLSSEGVKHIADAIKVTNCAIAIILEPFSCLSDCHSTAIVYRYPQDNKALSTLILSKNGIIKREVGTVLAGMLKANTVLTTLDISDCDYHTAGPDAAGFAQELAIGIKDNGVLIKIDICSNGIPSEQDGGLQRLCTAGGIDLVL